MLQKLLTDIMLAITMQGLVRDVSSITLHWVVERADHRNDRRPILYIQER